MSKALIFAALLAVSPAAAYAQDTQDHSVNSGAAAGGTVGGAVGGAVGAIVGAPAGVVGGVVGGLTGANAPRFHQYVVEEHIPSYTWEGHPTVVVGEVLPPSVGLYPVPREYGVTRYEYTIVDNEPVLVEPSTRRIVEIVP